MKTIKKLIKVSFITMLGLIIIGVFIGIVTDSSEPAQETTETTAQPKEEKAKITKETYDKIVSGDSLTGEGGMSIDEVTSLLGESESVVESEINGMAMKTFTWTDLFGTGGSITVTFINGKCSDKVWTKI